GIDVDADSAIKKEPRREKQGGRGRGKVTEEELAEEFSDMVMGEVTLPVKDGKTVLSKSHMLMVDLIRKFAIHALPKVAKNRSKVQILYLPGPATPLDNVLVAEIADALSLQVGHEYASDGTMSLYVAAGDEKSIAKLELEDTVSTGTSTPSFFAPSKGKSPFAALEALGSLEDSNYDNSSEDGYVKHREDPFLADFLASVPDPTDDVAVGMYVNECLAPFSDVTVVSDKDIDMYTRKGDESEFWQRFEMWKANYYKTKLDINYQLPGPACDDESLASSSNGQKFRPPPDAVMPMCRAYIQTLQWVLLYYYHGCQSWSWFYPYHYAPSISDLCANLTSYRKDSFPKDEPYTPYEQLMCVLPPYSRHLLPSVLRPLMVDANSPIRDLFPESFEVDQNGKRAPWEAVVLINFADIDRIRAAMSAKLPVLSEDEQIRNARGKNMVYSYAPLDVDEDDDSVP
ncbi:exonuclease II Exo2, partial [Linderina macrospora]